MNKTLRIGLLSASAIFFCVGLVLWGTGNGLVNPLSLALSMVLWLLGTLSAGLALLPSVPRRAVWLVLLAFIALALQIVYLNGLNYSPLTVDHTDNEMIGKYALEALKHGDDPYQWNFSDMTRVYRDPGLYLTPFLDGSYQNRFTYPALPMLVLWGFDRVELGQVRTVNAVFLVLLLILLFLGTPQKLRPLILLPLLVLSGFADTALGGAQDVVWCALLVGMILTWQRPLLRAVLFGLAAAFHQQPWLVAPFLLIALWYEGGSLAERARRIALFVGVSGGLFVLINLPFMFMDLRAWALGTFEPAYALFNMYSQGFASLSVYGVLSLPREFFTALQFAFLAIALVVHLRHRIGAMFWLFPAVFFWLYYRGLANYWIFWIPPLLIALARGEFYPHPLPVPLMGKADQLSFEVPRPHGEGFRVRTLQTTALNLLILALPAALGIHYATARPLITASLDMPIVTSYGGSLSSQLIVTVTNNDDHAFRPRFAVQHDGGAQAQPWIIQSGPDSLAAGESAQYTIGNDNNYLTAFPINADAQVVVSDADGSYQRRALVTIPADSSAASPDLIHNPAFAYWNDDGSLPIDWTPQPSTTVTASLQLVEGHQGLNITSGPYLTRLTQHITFPGPFTIWVHPSREVSPASGVVYGLEADDGFHRLWILFGSQQPQTVHAPANHATLYQQAPLNEWSQQTVDLKGLYQQLGWTLPSFALDADHPVRQIDLSLIVSDNQALFGAIDQDRDAMSLDHLVADAVAQPDQYYVYVAHHYAVQRDDEQAVQAYTTALSYNPASADAYLGMAQSEWRLGKFDEGLAAFKQGLSLRLRSLTH